MECKILSLYLHPIHEVKFVDCDWMVVQYSDSRIQNPILSQQYPENDSILLTTLISTLEYSLPSFDLQLQLSNLLTT